MENDDIEKEIDELIGNTDIKTTELTIKNQVENNPLTREESKAQFVKITDQLGIKHSFDFD